MSEIRFSIELAVIQGVLNGPTGIINEPCTVTVAKGSTGSSSISAANIQGQWSAMSAEARNGPSGSANDDTIQVIDSLAASGTFPEARIFLAVHG